MIAEIIIGGAVGAGTLYSFWNQMGATCAPASSNASSVKHVALSADSPSRVATVDDNELVAYLGPASQDEAAPQACGFTALGDIIIQIARRPAAAIMRARRSFEDGWRSCS